MATLPLSKILDSITAMKKDGAAYLLTEELDANLFVTLGHEVLQIPKVARIEVAADSLQVTTHKGERYYFVPEQFAGLRMGGDQKANRGSAGFISGKSL
jgi:hypothetical protein